MNRFFLSIANLLILISLINQKFIFLQNIDDLSSIIIAISLYFYVIGDELIKISVNTKK